MEDVFNAIIGIIDTGMFLILVLVLPVLIIFGTITKNRYIKRQVASGEDKQMLMQYEARSYRIQVGNRA